MSSSTKNKISLNFFEREQDINASDLVFFNEEIGDYYGDVSNSIVSFRSLSKQKCLSSEIANCKTLIQETLRHELRSAFK